VGTSPQASTGIASVRPPPEGGLLSLGARASQLSRCHARAIMYEVGAQER
jgi:hypothetical protein